MAFTLPGIHRVAIRHDVANAASAAAAVKAGFAEIERVNRAGLSAATIIAPAAAGQSVPGGRMIVGDGARILEE